MALEETNARSEGRLKGLERSILERSAPFKIMLLTFLFSATVSPVFNNGYVTFNYVGFTGCTLLTAPLLLRIRRRLERMKLEQILMDFSLPFLIAAPVLLVLATLSPVFRTDTLSHYVGALGGISLTALAGSWMFRKVPEQTSRES